MKIMPFRFSRQLAMFAATALATFVTLRPAPVTAAWRRQPANAVCRIVDPVAPTYDAPWGFQIHNPQALNYLRVLCPVVDTSNFMKENYTSVTLSVTDGSSSLDVDVKACVSYIGSAGGTCTSTANSTSGTGATTLTVNLSLSDHPWTSSTRSDFGYIIVRLPPKDFSTGAESTFRGIYTVI